jgi:hypothetical protein
MKPNQILFKRNVNQTIFYNTDTSTQTTKGNEIYLVSKEFSPKFDNFYFLSFSSPLTTMSDHLEG